MPKLILSIIALALAFVFTFVYPGSGIESIVVSLLAVVGSYFGINWRKQYDDLRNWFASKTIVGALSVAIPVLIIFLSQLFAFALPEWVNQLLLYIASAGGLGFLFGAYRAIEKNKIDY